MILTLVHGSNDGSNIVLTSHASTVIASPMNKDILYAGPSTRPEEVKLRYVSPPMGTMDGVAGLMPLEVVLCI